MSADEKVWSHHELGKELSNWGRWGDDDEVGTLNFITPEKLVSAARLVTSGKTFDLGMEFGPAGPFRGKGLRTNPQHIMTLLPSDVEAVTPDGMIASDDMIILPLQAATQWDSLAHVGYGGRFYNDAPSGSVNSFRGATRNSFSKANDKLISRGVLLDIARLKGVDELEIGYEITAADLEEAEERQGVRVESGDILCIRTGAYRQYLQGEIDKFMGDEAGPGLDTCRWLHDREVAAIALDNHACEVRPSPLGLTNPFHEVVLRDLGLMIGEMFNFEELAADSAEDGVWEFLLSATGLKITGSVSSAVTPIALK